MSFRPLNDRVVVELPEPAKQAGSIFIPDTTQEKPHEGRVIAVGPGTHDLKGALIAPRVRVGDRVIFGKWSGSEIHLDDKSCLVMHETDILAIIEGDGKVEVLERSAARMTEGPRRICSLDHIHDEDCC